MASENLAKLQATINRFASVADFSPIAIDGGMGPKTANAVIATLGFASDADRSCESRPGDLCARPEQAATARALLSSVLSPDGSPNQTQIMQSNVGLNEFLTQIANTLQLGAAATVALVAPQPALPAGALPTPNKSAFAVKAPPNASFIASSRLWFRQLPQWQQVGLGVGAGLGVMVAITALRKRKPATGTAGYRRKGR